MILYLPTNGPNRELCVDWDGDFVGWIAPSGNRWLAFTREMKPIGKDYPSRGFAATACRHACVGKRIPISKLAVCKVEDA